MAEKDNVRVIKKGVVIAEEEKFEPLPMVVEAAERILKEAKSGFLRELCYATAYSDKSSERNIVGEPISPSLVQNQLRILDMEYFEGVTYPLMGGITLEDILQED
jgi:hypothetical protein